MDAEREFLKDIKYTEEQLDILFKFIENEYLINDNIYSELIESNKSPLEKFKIFMSREFLDATLDIDDDIIVLINQQPPYVIYEIYNTLLDIYIIRIKIIK